MKAQIAVIGMGIFGREVALSLSQKGFAVLAIDRNAEVIEAVKDDVTRAMILDSTSERALLEANIDTMAIVVNAIGTMHIESSILTTALLKQLTVPRIIARATNTLHERILRQVGATEVINPEREMGRKVARQISWPGLGEVLPLAESMCVAQIPVPKSFVGKTMAQLEVRKKYAVRVIGVQRVRLVASLDEDKTAAAAEGKDLLDGKRRMILDVSAQQDRFVDADELIVIGREEDVHRIAALG